MRINVVSCQLLDHALSFIQRQKFRNADTDEGGNILCIERYELATRERKHAITESEHPYRVLELVVDFGNDRAHFF